MFGRLGYSIQFYLSNNAYIRSWRIRLVSCMQLEKHYADIAAYQSQQANSSYAKSLGLRK